MTIQHTKAQLIELVTNSELKVVALSGAWGTGKTHLWNEVRAEASDPAIRGSLYVSLFGAKDINQLKLKVVQSALPVGADSNLLTEGLGKAWKTGVEILKKVHPGFAAVDELALVAVPAALSNRFVVIDDLERKHAGLSVDEILGFVDEYSQRFGTRFLLILNSEKLSSDQDDALWSAFREKVVEDELRFTPTALEAFDIALPDLNAPYRAAARSAIDACGLTNIRVIRQAYRLVLKLLGNGPELSAEIQARTVPSIVLIAATYNKAIKDGPDLDFVVSFNRGEGAWLDRYQTEPGSTRQDAAAEPATPAAWKLLMSKLGINSADEFEELVAAYVREGKHDAEAISSVIQGYRENQDRLESRSAAHAFFNRFNWDVSAPDAELVADAEQLVSRARDLDAYTVTALCAQFSKLPDGASIEERMLDAWLAHFHTISGTTEFGDDPFNQPLHPRLKAAIDGARVERIQSATLVDTVKYLAEHSGWGHREEVAMRSASADDFEAAMRSLRGQDFKIFVLKSLDVLEQGAMYEKHFGDAGRCFLEACRRIVAAEPATRFGRLLRNLFAESKVPTLLANLLQSEGVGDESSGGQ